MLRASSSEDEYFIIYLTNSWEIQRSSARAQESNLVLDRSLPDHSTLASSLALVFRLRSGTETSRITK